MKTTKVMELPEINRDLAYSEDTILMVETAEPMKINEIVEFAGETREEQLTMVKFHNSIITVNRKLAPKEFKFRNRNKKGYLTRIK